MSRSARYTRAFAPAVLACSLLGAGCTGAVAGGNGEADDDPGGDDSSSDSGGSGGRRGSGGAGGSKDPLPGPGVSEFTCDAQAPARPAALVKLTKQQLTNSARDLIGIALGEAKEAQAVMSELSSAIASIPDDKLAKTVDDSHGTFRRLSQELQQDQVEGAYGFAVALGAALTKPSRLGLLLGGCATDQDAGNDTGCVSAFLDRFAPRVLLRPMDAAEKRLFLSVYGTPSKLDPAALADVLTVLFSAPSFLYEMVHGTADPDASGRSSLSPLELARRLALHFWDSVPDDRLWKAAADGSLANDAVFAAEVDRLLSDPRARVTLTAFASEWLKLDAVPDMSRRLMDPVFKTFAGSNLPTADLRNAMIDEIEDMFVHYTWTTNGRVGDLFTTPLSFARTAELAKVYGVPAWTGSGEPPRMTGRPGLLTRAALLASESGKTRPIMKGVFIRQFLLCDQIPPPPANVADQNKDKLAPTMSQRQVAEALTSTGSCAGCHTTLINPLGFATEGFDALGRARDTERVIDDGGKVIATVPVDTTSVPRVMADDTRPSSGITELVPRLVASGKVEACLARNYFRFTHARLENEDADGCTLGELHGALTKSDGSLRGMLRAVATSVDFKRRSFR